MLRHLQRIIMLSYTNTWRIWAEAQGFSTEQIVSRHTLFELSVAAHPLASSAALASIRNRFSDMDQGGE